MRSLLRCAALISLVACGSPAAVAPSAAQLPVPPVAPSSAQTEPPPAVPTADRISRIENGLVLGARVRGRPLATLADRMQAHRVHGVSVAVIDHFAIAWAKGYGEADAETHAPVTETTLFQAGSISKPVAAMAALALVQHGKLSLDTPIDDVLTTWKIPANDLTRATPVTLRQLLSHTAGFTVHGFPGYPAGAPLPTLPQILDGVPPANTDPIRVDMPPGKAFRYSGGGITVMQAALVDTTHEPFPKLLADSVLGPLGMSHSTYEQPLPTDRVPSAAAGYDLLGEPIVGKRHVYPEMAAAGLWTTPSDLARFAIELGLAYAGRSARVLSTETARTMLTPVPVATDGGDSVGLGIFVSDRHGTTYFGHDGSDEGFEAALIMDRDGGRGVAVMVNADDGITLAAEIERAVAIEYGWPGWVEPEVDLAQVDHATLASYAGGYLLNDDRIVRVRAEGDHLVLTTPFKRDAELLPVSPTEFVRTDMSVRYTFVPDADGLALKVDPPDQYPVCKRIAPGATVALDDVIAGRIEAATKRYRAGRATAKEGDAAYAFSEERLNGLGVQALVLGDATAAVRVFQVNVALAPDSMNARDSLAEAYFRSGDRARAAEAFRQSLAAFARDKKTPAGFRAALRDNAQRRLATLAGH